MVFYLRIPTILMEKEFMIGVIGKTKRVFDKVLYKEIRYKQAYHDANKEWVTVIGAICADGTPPPPLPPCGDLLRGQ